jgi:hypothetical protein
MAIWRLVKVFKNWEYVVLSRVHTLLRLYLIEPIDMDKLFNPSPDLRSYIEKDRKKEKQILEKYQIAMSQITWTSFSPDVIVELKRQDYITVESFKSRM